MSPHQDFLPFALPDIGEEEVNEVLDCLRSGWLTTGPKARQFEQEFAEYLQRRSGVEVEAVAVNSATAGLHLALEAVGVGPGDEVITTPYTFTATAEVVRYLGAHPVFVDIDPATFNINPAKIAAAITPRTKAIIPVHFGGLACDMEAILDIARCYGLRVVEDAAHAFPATCLGRIIGTWESDAVVYSFYVTKTIATGEGGMIVTRYPELAERCRMMRLHGINRDVFDRYTSSRANWYYEVVAPGYKYNLPDLAAAIGIHQLRKIDRFRKRREEMARRYDEGLRELPLLLPPWPPRGDQHAWHLYVVRLKDEARVKRNEFIELMAAKGIGCSVHFIPLHLHPYWRDTYRLRPKDFPSALDTYQRAVSLPLYTRMTDADQERVIKAIWEILG